MHLELRTNSTEDKLMTINSRVASEIAKKYAEAWSSHNPTAVAAFFAENGRISVNGQVSLGRGEIANMAQGFFEQIPDIVIHADAVRSAGTHMIVLWTFEGTNSGPDGNGNKVKVSGWEYWLLKDSNLVEESLGHFDDDDYQRQLG